MTEIENAESGFEHAANESRARAKTMMSEAIPTLGDSDVLCKFNVLETGMGGGAQFYSGAGRQCLMRLNTSEPRRGIGSLDEPMGYGELWVSPYPASGGITDAGGRGEK